MTTKEFASKLERRVAKADVLMPSAEVIERLEQYYALLSRWNKRINLTSLALEDAPPGTLDRLIVEPLAAARYVSEAPISWVDLGTGGGSPAIPLKIVRPAAALTMVEATTKKATFLKEVVRELQLGEALVENARIEEFEARTAVKDSFDLVSTRAVRMTGTLFAAIRNLLKPEGQLHLYANRPPEVTSSSGFAVEAAHKLGTGLETKLIVLLPARPMGAPRSVPRGTSPSQRAGKKTGQKKR